MKEQLKYLKGDRVIWIIVLLLSIISLLTVYSSTVTLAYKFKEGNTMYFMIKHAIILGFGLLWMYLASKLKYTYYSRIFQIALWIAIPLLLITLFYGETINQASRVLKIPGLGLTFQTSDLAKITLIVYLARELSLRQGVKTTLKQDLKALLLPIIAIVMTIMPANFSTAGIVMVISLVMMYIGKVQTRTFLVIFAGGITLILLTVAILAIMPQGKQARFATWKSRIESFFDKDKEPPYQVQQAKIAIATGSLWGKGPGNSTQRHFLPHPYSDFIYAIIIEEYGLIGGTVVLLLYLVFFFRSIRIAIKSPTMFGSFMVIGMAFSLVFQAMINMGVAVGLLPVTGQPLPLVSMGGTSLWFSSLAIGIILSVSREIEEAKQTENLSNETENDEQ